MFLESRTVAARVTIPSPHRALACLLVAALGLAFIPKTSCAQSAGSSAAKGALVGGIIGAGVAGIIALTHHLGDKEFRLEPASLDFQPVQLENHSDATVTIANRGTKQLRIDRVTVSGDCFSLLEPAEFPLTLEPGGRAKINVRFKPMARRTYSGAIEVQRSAGGEGAPKKVKVALKGRGAGPS